MEKVTREYTIYSFSELSEKAKEKARDDHRESNIEFLHNWYEPVYEQYQTAGKLLGIEIEKIYFSGFSSQGDGACFEGFYSYAKGWREKLETSGDFGGELQAKYIKYGEQLQELQQKWFYSIRAKVRHSGHYYHAYCTDFEISYDENKYPDMSPENFREIEEGIKEILRDYMKDIYMDLESLHDALNSDEYIDETIKANDYKFFESGEMFNL